jgi:tRNA threonylcarbamoyladenosine biosynthesis protein TsaE
MNTPAQGRPCVSLHVASEADTVQIAESVAALARRGDVIALSGDLGAGKTAFARGFIRALAGREQDVPSPTFTLLQVYETGATPIYHFDLYRIEAPSEVWELGFDEAPAEGIVLIEWPERLGPLLPADRLEITISMPAGGGETERRIVIAGGASWGARLERAAASLRRYRDD